MAVAVYGQKIGEMGLMQCPSGYTTHTVNTHGPVEQVCCPHGLEPKPVGTDKYGCFATETTPLPDWVQEALKRKPSTPKAFVMPPKDKVITVGIVAGVALLGVSWAFYKAFRGRRSQ